MNCFQNARKNSTRNAKERANRKLRKLNRDVTFNIQDNITQDKDIKIQDENNNIQGFTLKNGCILHCDGFDYYYSDKHNKIGSLNAADMLYGIYGTSFNPEAYLQVQAVFLYKEKYYFIPSSFSFIGTLHRMRNYQIIAQTSSPPTYLDILTCKKICPGFLD